MDSMSSASTASTNSSTSRRWIPIAGWTFIGLLGVTLGVFMLTVMFGGVH
jgi:hypothetical protein